MGTQGDRDVMYRRSMDDGRTWSPVTLLNDDDPAELWGQFQPNLSVAPDGRVDVAWWDHRDSAGRFVNDVYATHSTDSGATWSRNVRVTDQSISRTIGMWKPGTGGDVRQPPGVGAANALTYFVWDDTRNGTDQTETQDLYAATAQFETLAGDGLSRTAGYLLAIVLGVGAVGLVLLLASLAFRGHREKGPPAARSESGKEPVEVG